MSQGYQYASHCMEQSSKTRDVRGLYTCTSWNATTVLKDTVHEVWPGTSVNGYPVHWLISNRNLGMKVYGSTIGAKVISSDPPPKTTSQNTHL